MLYVCLNDFKISYFSVRVHLLLLKKFAFLCLGQLSSQQPLHFLRAPEDEEKNLLHKRAVGNGRWSSRENIKKLQMEIPEYCSVSMSNVHTEIPMKHIHGILYTSSTIQNQQPTVFRKISALFSLIRMIFYVINTLNMKKRQNGDWNNEFLLKPFMKLASTSWFKWIPHILRQSWSMELCWWCITLFMSGC